MNTKRPTELYVKAFMQHSGASEKELQYKRQEHHVLVLYKGTTYLIAHYEDIKDDYRRYFKGNYHDIYSKTPEILWDIMVVRELEISEKDMIICIYTEWRTYWERQLETGEGGKEQYDLLRRQSWEELQVLFETIKLEKDEAVKSASRINGPVLIPLIAMMIKEYFGNTENFLDSSLDILLNEFGEFVTMGETFGNISLKALDGAAEEFYIYNPAFEFEE